MQPADLLHAVALCAHGVGDVKNLLGAAKVLRFRDGPPTLLERDFPCASHEDRLHRVAKKTEAELASHLSLHFLEGLHDPRECVLTLVDEYEWVVQRHDPPEQRAVLQQEVGELKDVLVTEDALRVVTAHAVVKVLTVATAPRLRA